MDDILTAICERARERFPERVGAPVEAFGETSIDVARDELLDVVRYLRDEEGYDFLADWSAVDHLGQTEPDRRFLCAAHLASIREQRPRLRLRVWIPDGDETCPSLTGIWPTADFQEREMFDFFGIRFEGHPDLRRIFMPEEWEGHPQRKDYPLGGTNVQYEHGVFIPPPDRRGQGATTTGYPGGLS